MDKALQQRNYKTMPLSSSQRQEIISTAEAYVKKLLAKDTTGHDWYHIERVRRMAQQIAKKEGVDTFLVDLMALLHESTDRKLIGKKTEAKALLEVQKLLTRAGLDEETTEEILYFINNQSYSKSGVKGEGLDSKGGQCAQDADRLEALGAIGIARCFAYNGKKGNPIYDPIVPARLTISQTDYVQDKATSINHFYEKLLKLKDLMNTKTGKKIAEHRHKFLETFLAEFFAEWNGEK